MPTADDVLHAAGGECGADLSPRALQAICLLRLC
jgi:hypothetical protein